MSNQILDNLTKIVGYPTEDERIAQFRKYVQELSNKKEEIDKLKTFLIHIGPTIMCICPNFDFGWLSGPIGYSLSIHRDQPFRSDPFMTNLFRIISVFEIEPIFSISTPEKKRTIRSLWRKCVQEESLSFPDIVKDTENSGWGEALGSHGSRIGVYNFEGRDDVKQTPIVRMFIIVDSGLHQQTVGAMHDYMCDIHYSNLEKGSKISSLTKTTTKGGIITYGQEFCDRNGVFNRMLKCAEENNKRLAVYFSEVIDVVLKEKICSSGAPYNIPTLNEPLSRDKVTKAMEWWPKHAPITPHTIIPFHAGNEDVHSEAKLSFASKELQGFQLGTQIALMRQDDKYKTLLMQLEKDGLRFFESPRRVSASLETDYNTFRNEGNQVIWYSNCSSTVIETIGKKQGIICQLPIALGYEALNSDLFVKSQKDLVVPWKNQYLCSYPITFPFERSITCTGLKEETSQYFFSAYNWGDSISSINGISNLTKHDKTPPLQFFGSYKRISDMTSHPFEEKIKRDLQPQNVHVAKFTPIIVYLSKFSSVPISQLD